ncbi:hypothetical protein C8J57DRAFT_1718986 [Mycena rebaudengoi]|nr:hypothetical protein C8J57DRAFT_1718986 [Mycena rebaudengoi]
MPMSQPIARFQPSGPQFHFLRAFAPLWLPLPFLALDDPNTGHTKILAAQQPPFCHLRAPQLPPYSESQPPSGPSTLAVSFPACGLGVSVATDSSSTRRRCTPSRIHPSRVIGACLVVVRLAQRPPKLLVAPLACVVSRVRVGGAKSPATKKRWGDRPAGHSTRAGWYALHFPAIRRHRGPAPKLLILLRRHAERRALLPRPAPLVPSRPSVPAACTVGGVLVLDIGAPRVLRTVPRAAGLCARGQPADDGKRAEDKLVDDAGGMMRAEKMRKMPLSGLDPSMLIGFACRGGVGWVDLRRRIALDEPLTSLSADDDDDMGLESVWDPEEEAVDADDGEGSMRDNTRV